MTTYSKEHQRTPLSGESQVVPNRSALDKESKEASYLFLLSEGQRRGACRRSEYISVITIHIRHDRWGRPLPAETLLQASNRYWK
jgi:hypothetical protein